MKPLQGARESAVSQRLPVKVDLLTLAENHPERYPYLLESASSAAGQPGHDILFAFPEETLSLDDNALQGPGAEQGGFLDALDAWWSAEPQREVGDDLPFCGGWFVYLGYELALEVEPGLPLTLPQGVPTAFATRIPAAVITDHASQTTIVVAEADRVHLLDQLRDDVLNASKTAGEMAAARDRSPTLQVQEDSPGDFLERVESAKRSIQAGDIYQANLSRSWRGTVTAETTPAQVYRRLREANPAPFAGLMQHGDFAVMSSSPERLVRRRGRRIDTRPIAGTRPRLDDPAALPDTTRELLDHPKERAEHIMLIDLERNDLGRVCEGGSVEVDEFMVIESYRHVHHIVSNVTGVARKDVTPGQLIRAVFPGGTITGCPKVRCMEIIQALEQRPRGAYTGSMGYLSHNGDCDFNILIRTITMHGGCIELAAGSGIVADSEPERELEETRAKAKGMLLALGAEALG